MQENWLLKLFLMALLLSSCLLQQSSAFKRGEKGKHKKVEEPAKKQYTSSGELQVQVQYKPEQCPRKSKSGDMLTLHYVGKLADGTVFDTSYVRNEPISFLLGAGMVLPGWDRGLLGACEGEKRHLVVPPHYAFGEEGHPPTIPPRATLTFDVEIVRVSDPPSQEELEQQYSSPNAEEMKIEI